MGTNTFVQTVPLTDEQLLFGYAETKAEIAILTRRLGAYEQEIFGRLEERKAQAIPSVAYICEVKVANSYSQPMFTPFKELLNSLDLATCFTPAHQETVDKPDAWNTVKLLALAKRYGAEALAIVERARMPGKATLVFKAREGQ